ncbi:transglycosylase SLT domain-containing protein [Octadecabacter sp. R77987]|uniref:lytic transglycosylase domain-containing protein n=1 Tax=Octadecabacter sp. R77987 TaxID=3093874 RepID=UPI00366D1C72
MTFSARSLILCAALGALVSACSAPEAATPTAELTAESFPAAMRWDHSAQSDAWTAATFTALETHGSPLLDLVPADIASWCPAYPDADEEQRAAFWAGMLSTLAKHESTWNPQAVGGGGRWFGLVQIAPATARGYGCAAGSGAALQDGSANLSCAVRIAAVTVPRDGVVAAGGRGLAADWGPFHSAAKREDMRAWVSAQSYCQP